MRLVLDELDRALVGVRPRRILIKPNWVLHQTDPAFPIEALVTDARVVEATVLACLELFPSCDSIVVGDCPLQYADWRLLRRQSGLDAVIDRLHRRAAGKLEVLDLRRESYRQGPQGFLEPTGEPPGDPRGYREVELGASSHLEPLSAEADRFAVNDYSASTTRSNHRAGSHRYLVCQSVLDADLFVNLPKWKSHQKTGLTCALKNVVGINGDKAYLPHFRRGAPKWGGDEYRDDHRFLYFAQTTLRESLQKRSRLAYRALKPGWELIKSARGIETELKDPRAATTRFYVAGGAWPGNDTLWRTIYDLNLLLQCADADGTLRDTPQRRVVSVVDGLVCGEGNGPLQPLPRPIDWLAFGDDPFLIDTALAWFMGFDPERVPLLARRGSYAGPEWGDFELSDVRVEVDAKSIALAEGPNFAFLAPPGWRGSVER